MHCLEKHSKNSKSYPTIPHVTFQPEAYELEILGDLTEMALSLDDIKKLPKHTVKMTMQCSGNRRTEMVAARTEENGLPPVRGLAWTSGAISTAEWSGAKLRDVLLAAGLSEEMADVRLSCLESLTYRSILLPLNLIT